MEITAQICWILMCQWSGIKLRKLYVLHIGSSIFLKSIILDEFWICVFLISLKKKLRIYCATKSANYNQNNNLFLGGKKHRSLWMSNMFGRASSRSRRTLRPCLLLGVHAPLHHSSWETTTTLPCVHYPAIGERHAPHEDDSVGIASWRGGLYWIILLS